MIASALLLPPLQATTALGDGVASALYVGNYWFIIRGGDYFGGHLPASPFLHYWSLGVEEQFYLVWAPLLLITAWLIRRTRKRTRIEAASSQRPYLAVLALVAVVSFALSLVLTYVIASCGVFFAADPGLAARARRVGGPDRHPVAPPTAPRRRAHRMGRTRPDPAGLRLVHPDHPLPRVSRHYCPPSGALLVIGAGCATPAHGCGRLLGLAPMRAIGRISYSWYLWHWPVLVLARHCWATRWDCPPASPRPCSPPDWPSLTLRYLENPLRFAPKIRNSPWRSLGARRGRHRGRGRCRHGPHARRAHPDRTRRTSQSTHHHRHTTTRRRRPGRLRRRRPTSICPSAGRRRRLRQPQRRPRQPQPPTHRHRSPIDGLVGQRLYAPALSRRTTRVCGRRYRLAHDGSHRRRLPCRDVVSGIPTSRRPAALATRNHGQGGAARSWTRHPSPTHCTRLARRIDKCDEWRAEILTRLQAEHPKLIVVSMWRGYGAGGGGFEGQSGFHSYDPAWFDSLTRLVPTTAKHRRSSAGPRAGPGSAERRSDLPVRPPRRRRWDAHHRGPPRSTNAGITAEAAATEAGGGHYADLTDLFCTTDRCPVIVGNTLVYPDWTHITAEYSRALAPVMAALTARALAHP